MIADLIALAQQLSPLQWIAWLLLFAMLLTVVGAYLVVAARERRDDAYTPSMRRPAPQVRRHRHVSAEQQARYDSERFGGTRPPYGWELETRRAAPKNDDAASGQSTGSGPSPDARNLYLPTGTDQ